MSMSKHNLVSLSVVAATVSSGCDDTLVQPDLGEVEERAAQFNGKLLNGMLLNGKLLNGMLLNGMLLNGKLLNGPDAPTDYIVLKEFTGKLKRVTESWLVGSQWNAKAEDGATWSGTQLDKGNLVFEVREGGVVSERRVKIRDVAPAAPGSDVWLYDLDVKVDNKWQPLCLDNVGERTEAILLANAWDPSGEPLSSPPPGVMTFACRGAALAKCVEYGYRPWTSMGGVSIAAVHQACTRMLRADYCGDGVPHTTNGTPVHVLDQLGIQNVDPVAQYVVEAEWGPNGAVCLNAANRRHPELAYDCSVPACGESFASGGLIQSGKITP
jgi:hypothetical protein